MAKPASKKPTTVVAKKLPAGVPPGKPKEILADDVKHRPASASTTSSERASW